MRKCLHLIRRENGIYYWRRRLPQGLRDTLGKSHYCRSLATTVLKIARSRAVRFSMAIDGLEERLQILMKKLRQPARADLERILRDVFTAILDDYELSRVARLEGEDVWANLENAEPVGIPEDELEQYLADNQTPEGRIADWMRSVQANEYSRIRPMLDETMERHGLALPKDDQTLRLFERMMLVVVANAHRIGLERERGIYNPAAFPFSTDDNSIYASSLFEAGTRTLISEVYPQYLEYKSKEWGPHSKRKARIALNLFLSLIGDTPYATLTRQNASRFRNGLDKLPAVYAHDAIYKSKTPMECIVIAERIRKALSADKTATQIEVEGKTIPRSKAEYLVNGLHPTSVNNHLVWMHGFYEWRIRDGYFTGQNPFTGISHSEEREIRATNQQDRRKAWSEEALTTLFSAPIFTGAVSRSKRTEKGTVILEDHHFWAPLIALYSGLRQEEILQLWVEDIKTEQDIDVIHAAAPGPGRKGKTKSAERLVPIHDELKRLGLMEYVAAAKAAGSRFLFPGALRGGPNMSLENYYSKRFGDLRRRLKIPASYDFHAFRHTFSSELEGKHIQNENIVRYLMGHAGEGMNRHYMTRRDAKALQDIVNLLAPTNASHLHKEKQKRVRDFTLHPSRTKDHEVYFD